MTDRFPRLPLEIERHGPWRRLAPLAGDASQRRYARLWRAGSGTAIAVLYPVGAEQVLARDLEVRTWLEVRGLRVPRLLAAATAEGWALLEDFGAEDAATGLVALDDSGRAAALSRLLDPLEALARLDPEDLPSWTTPLDRDRLRWELCGFELWYLRHARRLSPSAGVGAWLDEFAAECAAAPTRVCHRDYHLNNLFLLDDGSVGIIDFQDVLVGPEAYDLVSLVGERDALELVSQPLRQAAVQSWAARTAVAAGWPRRVTVIAAQRGLKVLGTFARLEATRRTAYGRWLEPLAASTARLLGAVGAPGELVGLLLHSSGQGGPHVR